MKVVREAGKPLLIAVLAIAFGALLSLAKGSGEGLRLQMGNVSAPWLLAAFLAGSRYRRTGLAADSGVLATIAALSGFYAQQSPLADLSSASMRFIQIRIACTASSSHPTALSFSVGSPPGSRSACLVRLGRGHARDLRSSQSRRSSCSSR
jgi:hypothetical protein